MNEFGNTGYFFEHNNEKDFIYQKILESEKTDNLKKIKKRN